MKLAVDVDGILCPDLHEKFRDAKPLKEEIEILNELYNNGFYIMIYTARGVCEGDKDAFKDTCKQLDEWGVKYHEFCLYKPFYDLIVDDKAFQSLRALKKAIENLEK